LGCRKVAWGAAEKRLKRLFTKKHRSLLTRKGMYRG